jgi:hypothetical protein
MILITDFVLIRENAHYHNRYRLCDPAATGLSREEILALAQGRLT